MKPAAKRVVADYLQSDYEVGVTRACGLIGISRSSYRYQSCRGDDAPLRTAIRQKAQERKRWGYRQLLMLLQRDGHMDNHKRIYRIYREEGLQVRKRRRKRARSKRSFELLPSSGANQRWSMDFMHDSTASGRKLRILNRGRRLHPGGPLDGGCLLDQWPIRHPCTGPHHRTAGQTRVPQRTLVAQYRPCPPLHRALEGRL